MGLMAAAGQELIRTSRLHQTIKRTTLGSQRIQEEWAEISILSGQAR